MTENPNNELKPISRREFLKSAATVLFRAAAACLLGTGCVPSGESAPQPNSKEDFNSSLINFTWEDAKNSEKLNTLVGLVADKYLELNKGITNLTKSELLASNKLQFFWDRNSYLNSIRQVNPGYDPSPSQWGYTFYETDQVFIDLSTMESLASEITYSAGLAIIDACWHEWAHRDVTERTTGNFIGKPEYSLYSPTTNTVEQIERYRGAAIYTRTYYGFLHFEEVLIETITILRMQDQLKLEAVVSAKDYYELGVDFFPLLVKKANISVDQLATWHSTSDLDNLATAIGNILPGSWTAIEKGMALFVAIHSDDRQGIIASGAYDVINGK